MNLEIIYENDTELADSGYYLSEPNTVLVKEASKKEIEDTITQMYRCKYFQRLDNRGF